MIRSSVLIGTLLAPVNAVADPIVELSAGYIACFQQQSDDTARLACYDGLTDKVAAATTSPKAGCQVDGWNLTKMGKQIHMSGSTSWSSGRLNCRLFDGDNFLASGFTFSQGYAFQEYTDLNGAPAGMTMKFLIDEPVHNTFNVGPFDAIAI